MNANAKRILEVKAMVMTLIEKLIEKYSQEPEIKLAYKKKLYEIEKLIKIKMSGPTDCTCEEEEDSDTGFKNYMNGKKITCYYCLTKYMAREREIARKTESHGVLRADYVDSESSSDSTSSGEDAEIKKRPTYSKHKLLRMLRRKFPESFELSYLPISIADLNKLECIEQCMIPDELDEPVKKPKDEKPPKKKDFDVYAPSQYKITQDVELRKKLSSSVFSLLSVIVHSYQRNIKENKKRRYSDVTELMLKSSYFISKTEEDVIFSYYKTAHRKGRSKIRRLSELRSVATTSETSLVIEKVYECTNIKITVPEEMLYEAMRTGRLDLSNRSLLGVPDMIWSLETMKLQNRKIFGVRKRFKSLITLNLSNNHIETFCAHGKSFQTLVKLLLCNNKIEELPSHFANFTNLTILSLANNELRKLPRNIHLLKNLKKLDASENSLSDLPKNFGNLKFLTTLDLRWNNICRIPDSITNLASLKLFNVAYNKLRMLPESFSNLYKITIINVSYNRLKELPVMSDLPQLVLLNAIGNFIKTFPRISNCRSLCELRLDGNRFKAFGNLPDCPLVQLTLAYNKICEIPVDLSLLETLVVLDLTNNELTQLPFSILRLKYLTCLKVEQNPIENIDKSTIEAGTQSILQELQRLKTSADHAEEVLASRSDLAFVKQFSISIAESVIDISLDPKEMIRTNSLILRKLSLTSLEKQWLDMAKEYNVSTVDISKNNFRFVPIGLRKLALSLKHLIIRNNKLVSLPDFVGRMYYLVTLDLTGNFLHSIPFSVAECPLKTLVCKRNSFSAIPKVVFSIYTIEFLDFSENKIKELDVNELKQLHCLTHLNLKDNCIEILPSTLGFLTNIQKLDVTGNRFVIPNKQILKQGTADILRYLRNQNDILNFRT